MELSGRTLCCFIVSNNLQGGRNDLQQAAALCGSTAHKQSTRGPGVVWVHAVLLHLARWPAPAS